MVKHIHEIRDPIHVFIRLDSEERKVVNSRPFQRLRHIHQLALTHLVYPGATHRRFEHSLGVMELASRIYDVVTHPANLDHSQAAKDLVPPAGSFHHQYWRQVVRMAALCHDIGHLPFSHAAEKELLPSGWDHERISDELILSPLMAPLWKELKIQASDVAKLALGPKKFGPKKHRMESFNEGEAILAEIIVGDAFGADRMDYLLRDSYHAGVAYGKFDHYRLIDTLRILPKPKQEATSSVPGEGEEEKRETTLGVAEGGLHSAEALLLARYFMYTQLYFHPVRRIYDIHLKEFLKRWLPGGIFSTKLDDHLNLTDNEVMAAILAADRDPEHVAHAAAKAIVKRDHFRLVYKRNPNDVATNPEAAQEVSRKLAGLYADTNVYYDSYKERSHQVDFPVLAHDGRVLSCLALSETLRNIPVVAVDFVFIAPAHRKDAENWLKDNAASAILPTKKEEEA